MLLYSHTWDVRWMPVVEPLPRSWVDRWNGSGWWRCTRSTSESFDDNSGQGMRDQRGYPEVCQRSVDHNVQEGHEPLAFILEFDLKSRQRWQSTTASAVVDCFNSTAEEDQTRHGNGDAGKIVFHLAIRRDENKGWNQEYLSVWSPKRTFTCLCSMYSIKLIPFKLARNSEESLLDDWSRSKVFFMHKKTETWLEILRFAENFSVGLVIMVLVMWLPFDSFPCKPGISVI